MHKNGGYRPEDFVHKSLTMEAVRATYNFMIHPVPSQEYWTPTGCEGINPPPIVPPAGCPVKRRVKDHIDMIIGNKVRKTCQRFSMFDAAVLHNFGWDCALEKVRKSKKKKPRMASSGQHEEMDFSQSAPTLPATASTPEPFVSPPAPPAPLLPSRFRAKQPIIKPPTTNSATLKDPQAFTFMPTLGFKPPR
ncbi:hypothetical protein PIB30_050935 [Stylosanthes scabra]|uniref:Uncharacterized protein n=1 Tax=Stylosanthes scabra TaxID=79078 RepID=A0ABU6SHV1_9FABA|nr:hypothetical protein [Stylosanthes scabra]